MLNINLPDTSNSNTPIPDVNISATGVYNQSLIFTTLKTATGNIAVTGINWNDVGTITLTVSNLEAILGAVQLNSSTVRSINFTDLKSISDIFFFNACTLLDTMILSELVSSGGFALMPSTLSSLILPKLKTIAFFQDDWGNLTNVDMPSLENVIGAMTINSITTINVPKLKSIGSLYLNSLTGIRSFNNLVNAGSIGDNDLCGGSNTHSMTEVNLPSLLIGTILLGSNNNTLQAVRIPNFSRGSIFISNATALNNFNLANNLNPIILNDINITNCTSLTTFSFPTLNAVLSSSVSFTGCALNQTSIDSILIRLSQLTGSNGTTLFGAGKIVTLTGGTNATPSAAGLAAKTILVNRGATVTNN